MNKKELVDGIAAKTGFTKKDVSEVVDVLTSIITNTLVSGDDVKISGFGTFTVTERAARVGRNPLTGEKIDIKATKNAKFKPSAALKDDIKGE